MSNINNPLQISHVGASLLNMPLLNKGTAFTEIERKEFKLQGLLPCTIETLESQSARAYQQFLEIASDYDRSIYLRNLQNINETLFYHLVTNHLEQMMPIIYTPTVGKLCQQFSKDYLSERGLFINFLEQDHIDDILQNIFDDDIKVIVVTDGERILGLGDLGIGGMGIPIGKLSLYTACGGINPANTLPITLDVGTNNQALLDDPFYMGWKSNRITGDEYFNFIDKFIKAVIKRWPKVLLQFEDFAQHTAIPLLERYRDKLCCFNDDVQGTAAVTVGCLMAATKAIKSQLRDQIIVFLGAGSAGCGIAEQIILQMIDEGLTDIEARQRIFMVDRYGLLVDNQANLMPFQKNLAQRPDDIKSWDIGADNIMLLDVIKQSKATVLVGVSGQSNLFSEQVIRQMYVHCPRPIIMPLSNPTSKIEAHPKNILTWTDGSAIVATGSPFMPIEYKDKTYAIAQCNNSYIFPGIGLGVIASGATHINNEMLMAASCALASTSPMATTGKGDLLPSISSIQNVTLVIAYEVAKAAIMTKVANPLSDQDLKQTIEQNFWKPVYRPYKYSV